MPIAGNQQYNTYVNAGACITDTVTLTPPSVKSAKKALKHARAAEQRARKEAKAAARAERRRQDNERVALNALRELAQDKNRGYARVEAAKELLNRTAGTL